MTTTMCEACEDEGPLQPRAARAALADASAIDASASDTSASDASTAAATRNLRHEALRAHPRCAVEVMHAASALGIDLVQQPELAFLAELALCSPLPAGWSVSASAGGASAGNTQLLSYRHEVSGVVSMTHPLVAFAQRFRL